MSHLIVLHIMVVFRRQKLPLVVVLCAYTRTVIDYLDCVENVVTTVCGKTIGAWQREATTLIMREADFDKRCTSLHLPNGSNYINVAYDTADNTVFFTHGRRHHRSWGTYPPTCKGGGQRGVNIYRRHYYTHVTRSIFHTFMSLCHCNKFQVSPQ